MLSALAFNFFVNSALSFGGALVIVWAALGVFRVRPGRTQLALLALPWLKVAWDAARGIPYNSFFWQRLGGARQDLGTFMAGFGVSRRGPLIQLQLGAKLDGHDYPQSAAEILHSWLSRLWPGLPGLLTALVLLVGGGLVARRLAAWRWHAIAQRRSRQTLLGVWQGAVTQALIVVDPEYTGAPYATGVLWPRVVFSAAHLGRLSAAERDACLLHELAHLSHGDTLWSPLLSLLTDMFWFLPGARWVLARFRSVMELRADAGALRAGASPHALASALLATGEHLQAHPSPAVGLARERLLLRRVRRLLEPEKEPAERAGFQYRGGRLVLLALLISAVLQAMFFGNKPLG